MSHPATAALVAAGLRLAGVLGVYGIVSVGAKPFFKSSVAITQKKANIKSETQLKKTALAEGYTQGKRNAEISCIISFALVWYA